MRTKYLGLALIVTFASTASPGTAAEPTRSLALHSLDGRGTILVSCGEGATASVAIVQRPQPPLPWPHLQLLPAPPDPRVVFSIDNAGPFSAEWERRDDGAVVTKDSRQAKAFLIELLGREFLFVSVNRPPSYEFRLGGFAERLAGLVSGCR